jgi:hypothetical protein
MIEYCRDNVCLPRHFWSPQPQAHRKIAFRHTKIRHIKYGVSWRAGPLTDGYISLEFLPWSEINCIDAIHDKRTHTIMVGKSAHNDNTTQHDKTNIIAGVWNRAYNFFFLTPSIVLTVYFRRVFVCAFLTSFIV